MEEQLRNKHEVLKAGLEALRTLPNGDSSRLGERLDDALFEVFSLRTVKAEGEYSTRSLPKWLKSAAITTLAIAALVAVVQWDVVKWSLGDVPAVAGTKTFSTHAGQRATITLPDNSTIILAPQSSISYQAGFGDGAARVVNLKGQALFTVGHAAGKPFVVQTDKVVTRVLGTLFSVRRYESDSAVRIVVAQGRVAIGESVLGTGDVATAQSKGVVFISRGNALVEELAWAEGHLVFRGAKLREVIPELERWYGITVTVEDQSLLNRPVITTLDTETPSRALGLVALSLEASAKLSGNHAVIYSR